MFAITVGAGQPISTAWGSTITDEHGVSYLDFFAGAGALSYGHNNPIFVESPSIIFARAKCSTVSTHSPSKSVDSSRLSSATSFPART